MTEGFDGNTYVPFAGNTFVPFVLVTPSDGPPYVVRGLSYSFNNCIAWIESTEQAYDNSPGYTAYPLGIVPDDSGFLNAFKAQIGG